MVQGCSVKEFEDIEDLSTKLNFMIKSRCDDWQMWPSGSGSWHSSGWPQSQDAFIFVPCLWWMARVSLLAVVGSGTWLPCLSLLLLLRWSCFYMKQPKLQRNPTSKTTSTVSCQYSSSKWRYPLLNKPLTTLNNFHFKTKPGHKIETLTAITLALQLSHQQVVFPWPGTPSASYEKV